MIQVKNISKRYGNHDAVKNISFDITPGKIYGLLGPNGAGKSTTMNIIAGCLSATSGSVIVDGKDILQNPVEAKKKIGYLPETPPLYTEMTPYEYLSFVAEAKGVPQDKGILQVKEALSLTGTDVVADRLIRNLSKGYKQRVGIAQALLGSPPVIILDEPTVGLDPKQLIEIRSLIKRLGENKTIIVSSHILSEISAVCNHIMIISHGNLVANSSIDALKASASEKQKLFITTRGTASETEALLKSVDGIYNITQETGTEIGTSRFSMDFNQHSDPRDTLFYAFANNKMPLLELMTTKTTLEDIFIQLTENEVLSAEEDLLTNIGTQDEYVPLFSSKNSKTEDEI